MERAPDFTDWGPLPDGFKFGVATSAFQVEGGLNGPGEPSNNWVWWERSGRVDPSGSGVGFWKGYEELLDRAAAMGCDAFRLGVEWARVEPEQGQIDDSALDRYAAILDACAERHMEPLVTLHHFTHPAWLGDDFWLSSGSPELYAGWVRLVIDRLGAKCSNWITLNEVNIVAFASYVVGIYPPGRRLAMGDFHLATAHLLAAHVRGYEEIHARFPNAAVTTNNSATSVYEQDRMLTDLLVARSSGIAREDIEEWLTERRRYWYEAIDRPNALERLIRRATAATGPVARSPFLHGGDGRSRRAESPFSPALDAIYSSPHPLTLDALAIDYYDPVASNHVALPGHATAGGRSLAPGSELWDDKVNPEGLARYVRANVQLCAGVTAEDGKPLDLWVVENGLCNRVKNGRSYERLDAWDRPRYMRENLAAVMGAIDGGLPLTAYYHWSLVDNYEWGSYEPRFGIHGVDRERNLKVLETDSMGRDAAGTYKRLIAGLRENDRAVLRDA